MLRRGIDLQWVCRTGAPSGRSQPAIDPQGCIDCAVCVPECPVDAIYAEDDLPADQQHFLQLNAEIAASGKWPMINTKKDPHPQHEQFKALTGKLHLLDRGGA